VAKPVSSLRDSKKKRVLWLIDSLTTGGAERLVPVFARHFDDEEFELEVVSLKEIEGNAMASDLDELQIPLTVIGARNLRDLSAFRKLLRFIRNGDFDLIHTHLTYADIWGRVAGLITRVPVVSTVHVLSYTSNLVPENRAKIIERIADLTRKHLGGPVIAVSDSLKQRFIEKGYGERRLVTIRNGIALEEFELSPGFSREKKREEFGIPASAVVVATVSALREGKGHRLLLDAARLVTQERDVKFLIVGGGPLEETLRKNVDELGIAESVIFTGMRRDIPELLAISDIFVLPSENDSLPTAIFEAMSLGLPAVGLNSGGVPEIIDNTKTGIVLDSPRADDIADAIMNLLNNPKKASAMGVAARRRAIDEFSAERWVDNIQTLYRTVLTY
jgi:glycosyltransferase involved in cell wall biosynthesis